MGPSAASRRVLGLRPAFFSDIVPDGRRRTLEIGTGEGRVARDLKARGYDVVAIDGAPTLLAAAAASDLDGRYVIADAARLPFPDAAFELVVAYNCLMDMDDMPGTVREASRVLRPEGHLCVCVTHPMADAGSFAVREAAAPFIIEGDYLTPGTFDQSFERAGLRMRFFSRTFSIETYSRAFEAAGLAIELIREPAQRDEAVDADPAEARWQRLPNFLFLRGVKV